MVVGHSLHSKKMRLRCLPSTVWKNEKFTLNLKKKIRENSTQCNIVLDTLISRNFCKIEVSKFLQFPHCALFPFCGNLQIC